MNTTPSWWQTNLTLLQLRDPFSHAILSSISRSEGILPVLEPPIPAQETQSRWVFQIGLGSQASPPPVSNQHIWVIEPIPELTWSWWRQVDYHEWLIHPNVSYVCRYPQDVMAWLHGQLNKLPQVPGVSIHIEASYQAVLAEREPELLKQLVLIQSQILQRQSFDPIELSESIKDVYQEFQPVGEATLDTYPNLSCRNGCADCCQTGCGWNLLLQPGEWLVLWESLQYWPIQQQQTFFQDTLALLQNHHALLQPVWAWTMKDPHLLKKSHRTQELDDLLGSLTQTPCPLLDSHQQCQAYDGRPLVCRLFGQSHWSLKGPYTCFRDWDIHLQILAKDGINNQLPQARYWYQRIRNLHEHFHFHQILLFWLLAHMDLEQQKWTAEPLLDWNIFEHLPNKFSQIKQSAL